jgi:TonB family protein
MQFVDEPMARDQNAVQPSGQSTMRWDDVFVSRRMPARPFAQSAVAHLAVLALILGASRLNWQTREIGPLHDQASEEVVHYTPPEYLPPLDTRSAAARTIEPPDPAYSRQEIISLPREADNRSQTIVTAAQVKLSQPIALPNMLEWPTKTRMPIAPAPILASEIERLNSPRMENAVVAPPPDVSRSQARRLEAPQASVIAPPSAVDTQVRKFGDITVAQTAVIAPAPQLAVAAQRSYAGMPSGKASASAVVAPPPSLAGGPRSSGRMVALNLQPAVGAPPATAGNRRGSFAATPEGRHGGSGAPAANSANGSGAGGGTAPQKTGLPAGLYVGKAPAATATVAGSAANPSSPRATANVPTTAKSDASISPAERQVFGDRRIYSLTLNMPNLNSASGSWIVRFAERNAAKPQRPDPNLTSPPSISAPVAIHKVDPAYPTELMRENVAGTVLLYAIIRADGSVADVRVIEGADDRLDLYAQQALARWQFHPATKGGSPVDVEAVFRIPFKPLKRAGF